MLHLNSHNQQEVLASPINETPGTRCDLGQVNGLHFEIEFLEDKESRWAKIFELLESELVHNDFPLL